MPFTHRGDSVGNSDSAHGGINPRTRDQIIGLVDKESKGRYLRSTSSSGFIGGLRQRRGERMVNKAMQKRWDIRDNANASGDSQTFLMAQNPADFGHNPSAGRYKKQQGID